MRLRFRTDSAARAPRCDRDPAQVGEFGDRGACRRSGRSRDALTPPNGICASSCTVGPLMWQMPDSMRWATASAPRDVAAEHRGREAVFGVVGDADRLVVALDADHRFDRAEGFLRRRCASPASRGRARSPPYAPLRWPPATSSAPLATASSISRRRARPPPGSTSEPSSDMARAGRRPAASRPWRRACRRRRRRRCRRR